ncbi:MAG: hypothetical protein JXL80_18195 [Planctomycetes bacterium]|nr:hypothetical protein [Planctomycetota bacterium]
MTSAMQRAFAGAQAALRQSHGETVVYRRGETTVEVRALEGRSGFEAADQNGAVVYVESRDWLIAAADLVLGEAVVEPQAGDTITVTRPDGKQHVYEVMPVGSESHFRISDNDGATLRIHTKEVAVEA